VTREVFDQSISFHLISGSGVPPYLQLVQQVKRAIAMGVLEVGDRLPTVKQVVAEVAVNPNTVLKAYRELEHEGLAAGRPGVGTFVTKSFSIRSLAAHGPLRRELARWFAKAERAGLDDESIRALFEETFKGSMREVVA
jgi:GntR family transcriptional regulator